MSFQLSHFPSIYCFCYQELLDVNYVSKYIVSWNWLRHGITKLKHVSISTDKHILCEISIGSGRPWKHHFQPCLSRWRLVPSYSALLLISTRFLLSLFKRCRTCNYLENGNSWINATSHSGNAGEFWRTWTLDPKFKWEHSRAQSQHLTQLSGKQWCQSVTTGAIRHFPATSNIPQYLQFRDLKLQEEKKKKRKLFTAA